MITHLFLVFPKALLSFWYLDHFFSFLCQLSGTENMLYWSEQTAFEFLHVFHLKHS